MTESRPASSGPVPRDMLAGQLIAPLVLVRSGTWSLVGNLAPLAVALVTVPLLIRDLGIERFGILLIAWSLVGYFGLFDLGLGRTLTQFAAERLGQGRAEEIPALVWTAVLLMGVLGAVAGAMLWLAGPSIGTLIQLPVSLRAETVDSVRWLALSLPFVVTTAALRGLLQAHQRFGTISLVQIPTGILNFGAPLIAVACFGPDLRPVTLSLVLLRVAACLAFFAAAARMAPAFWRAPLSVTALKGMLFYGGWLTVSNLVCPLVAYLDRFMIGSYLSLHDVTYYVTPFEIIFRTLILPDAIIVVLFPAIATQLALDRSRIVGMVARVARIIISAMLVVALIAGLYARELLAAWLGAAFAANSAQVLVLLAIGVVANAFGRVPYAVIEGAGRADVTAKINLCQMPFYAAFLLYAVPNFGIAGAAAAWTAHAIVGMSLMSLAAARLVPELRTTIIGYAGLVGVLVAAIAALAAWTSPFVSAACVVLAITVCAALAWHDRGVLRLALSPSWPGRQLVKPVLHAAPRGMG